MALFVAAAFHICCSTLGRVFTPSLNLTLGRVYNIILTKNIFKKCRDVGMEVQKSIQTRCRDNINYIAPPLHLNDCLNRFWVSLSEEWEQDEQIGSVATIRFSTLAMLSGNFESLSCRNTQNKVSFPYHQGSSATNVFNLNWVTVMLLVRFVCRNYRINCISCINQCMLMVCWLLATPVYSKSIDCSKCTIWSSSRNYHPPSYVLVCTYNYL